jgi:signal transduction histidine kinase
LGADPDRFLIVQLAVRLVEHAKLGLGLTTGATREELSRALDLSTSAVDAIRAEVPRFAREGTLPSSWSSPYSLPLLPDLLRLALENRRAAGPSAQHDLQAEVDALHNAVCRQHAGESTRLQESKLRALAEVAAGAGHEINNPLAVISGQAQYLLSSEHEPARRKALHTIVGQTQRIHQVLTGLMQFARPQPPQKQPVDLGGLLREVHDGLQQLADERQVQLQLPETPPPLTLLVDAAQMRTVLTALVKNAIEAAPPAGWARLSIERMSSGALTLTMEDSGVGPNPHDREHLFDPFYSGRKAGRGRGLGLSTAWQLARLHGGEVRYEGSEPTRFVLRLPGEAVVGQASALVPPPRTSEDACPTTAAEDGLGLSLAHGNGIAAHG